MTNRVERRLVCRNRRRPRVRLGFVAALAALFAGCGEEPQIVFDNPPADQTIPAVETSTTTPTTTSTADGEPSPPTTPTASPPITSLPPVASDAAEQATIEWNGSDGYLHGANLPWINFGCDFGCGQEGGVSSPFARAAATDALARAQNAGMSTVRWWLFPDIRPHVNVDAAGQPIEFKPSVYEDIDTALALAEEADVDLIFTLFPGPLEIPPEWLSTAKTRSRLVDVLDDVFVRYADHPRIMTWQVMNEPEWSIWNNLVDVELVRDLVSEVAERVHETTSALVSLGSARMDGLPLWTDVGLDYLTVHWYDNMTVATECVPCASYTELARSLDTELPILIGEFHLNQLDPVERLERFRDQGYAGALAWSLLPDRTADGLDIVDDASREFAAELE